MSRRVRGGQVVLAAWACAGAVWGVVAAALDPTPGARHSAVVAEHDTRRLAEFADLLPPGTTVGYVTNDPDDPEATQAYYLAQYVLAPCVVVPGDGPEFVLVDDRPGAAVRPQAVVGRLLHDGGDGVRLYRRRVP